MNEQVYLRTGPGIVGYRTKVTGKTSLWGGDGVRYPVDAPDLVLLVRNDPRGEPVRLSKRPAGEGEATMIAALEPGEVFAVRVNQVRSVFAEAAHDTYVECALMPAHW